MSRHDRLPDPLGDLNMDLVLALVFLHDLRATEQEAGPLWARIRAAAPEDLEATIRDAFAVCAEQAEGHLDGFFPERLDTSYSTWPIILDAVEKACARGTLPGWPVHQRLGHIFQINRALSSKQARGAFFTPWSVAHCLAMITMPQPQDWLVDPAVGGGVLLAAALHVVTEEHGPVLAQSLTLLGVELDAQTAQVARASLLLAGAVPNQFWISCGDSLTQSLVGRDRESGELRELHATCSLANPPFGTNVYYDKDMAPRDPLIVPDHILYREIPVAPAERDEPAALPVASEPPDDNAQAA